MAANSNGLTLGTPSGSILVTPTSASCGTVARSGLVISMGMDALKSYSIFQAMAIGGSVHIKAQVEKSLGLLREIPATHSSL
jgi:hypothetical protein